MLINIRSIRKLTECKKKKKKKLMMIYQFCFVYMVWFIS